MSKTFLVAGATGSQGGETARVLLKMGHKVHTIAREPSSPQSLALSSLGVKIIAGSWDDVSALEEASQGIAGVFINCYPSATPGLEVQHGTNILNAAKAAGATTVVYSSAIHVGEHEKFLDVDPNGFIMNYFLSKHGIEEIVRHSGLKYTI